MHMIEQDSGAYTISRGSRMTNIKYYLQFHLIQVVTVNKKDT